MDDPYPFVRFIFTSGIYMHAFATDGIYVCIGAMSKDIRAEEIVFLID